MNQIDRDECSATRVASFRLQSASAMARFLTLAGVLCVLLSSSLRGEPLLLDGFEDLRGWETGGQKEITFSLSDRHVSEGEHSLHLHVEIDHEQGESVKEVKYPMGWPAVRKTYAPGIDLSTYDFIEMDIYFESARSRDPDFALNVTAKNAEGKGIYRAVLTSLRHGRWAHVKLGIRGIPAAASFGWLSFWLSESTYDHGDVIDFHIDNLRASRAEGFQSVAPKPIREPIARSESGLLWREGSARKVHRAEQVEFAVPPKGGIDLWAAGNEVEAAQLVFRPANATVFGKVTVAITELTGPGEARIPSENVSWYRVAYVPDDSSPVGGYPDPLAAPQPFTVDQLWNYPIWLEVAVPSGTAPGDYRGWVTVSTPGGDFRVELRVHVWGFSLPVKQSLRTSTTIYGPWGWREDIKGWFGDPEYWPFMRGMRDEIIRMLARYRLSPAALWHLPLAYDDEKKAVVVRDTAEFEKTVQSYLDLGHRMDLMPVPYFFDRKGFLGADKGTDEYIERIGQAYGTAAKFLEKKGWLSDCYVYCVDECVVHKHSTKRDFGLLNRVFDTIHSAHPGIRVFGAETPSPVLRGVNIWCTNVNNFNTDVLREQHALGNQVWWYNGYGDPRPGTRINARAVDHRVLFWMTYKYGIDGYLVWTVNRWLNNPWENPRPSKGKPMGDHFLLYPNPDGTISPSLRLAMMRDGIEDYEYHVLLQDCAGRLRQAGRGEMADACENTLVQADAFILSYDNCRHIHPGSIYAGRQALAEKIEWALSRLAEIK